MDTEMDYREFVRQRIAQLRQKRNVSEYQMSYDLGQNKNYIQSISTGKSLPSMMQFFRICAYFSVTPAYFFDSETQHPELASEAIAGMRALSREDLLLVLSTIRRLQRPGHIS